MIRIMKASAGSGKTFNLAKTYIRLLLTDEERYSYRQTYSSGDIHQQGDRRDEKQDSERIASACGVS